MRLVPEIKQQEIAIRVSQSKRSTETCHVEGVDVLELVLSAQQDEM